MTEVCKLCNRPLDESPNRAKERAEAIRINEEWATHNPAVFLHTYRDPSEFKARLEVVAGPYGFYGSIEDKAFLGPRRDTKEEALADAAETWDLTIRADFAGLQFAWSELHRVCK